MHAPTDNRRRGATLLEFVIAMAIVSILMSGIASAMYLATRAVPDDRSGLSAVNEAFQAVELLSDELYTAQSFSRTEAKAIEFLIADRNGDGNRDTIRYEWSGVAGAPLIRQLNSDPTSNVAEDVREFTLTLDIKSESSSTPPSANETEELVLYSYDGTTDLGDGTINKTNWMGQYFKPTMPADATAWKITKVCLRLKSKGTAKGVTRLQFRQFNALTNLPTATVLEEATILEETLTDKYVWYEFPFSTMTGLLPTKGACFTLQWVSDTDSCAVRYRDKNAAPPNSQMFVSSNSGAIWTTRAGESLLFCVHGTITTPSAENYDLKTVAGVRIRLRVGNDGANAVESMARLLNEPEVQTIGISPI